MPNDPSIVSIVRAKLKEMKMFENFKASEIKRAATTLKITSFNGFGVSEFKKSPTITMVTGEIYDRNGKPLFSKEDIQDIIDYRIREEVKGLAEYAADFFPYDEYTDVSRREIVDIFRRCMNTSTFKANVISSTIIADATDYLNFVKSNDTLESDIRSIARICMSAYAGKFVEHIKTKKSNSGRLMPLTPASVNNGIAIAKVEAEFLEEPIYLDVFVSSTNELNADASDVARKSLTVFFTKYINRTTDEWMRAAESASTSHETRITYAQQLVDLIEFEKFFKSGDMELKVINTVSLPWYSREFSKAEHDTFLSNARKTMQRGNNIKFASMFDAFQAYRGTRHPDGVMY